MVSVARAAEFHKNNQLAWRLLSLGFPWALAVVALYLNDDHSRFAVEGQGFLLAIFVVATYPLFFLSANRPAGSHLFFVLLASSIVAPICWIVFNTGYDPNTITADDAGSVWLSWLCFCLAVSIVGFTCWMCKELVGRRDTSILQELLRLSPVSTIASFFSLFLLLTFELSLAVAFEDRAQGGKALQCDTKQYPGKDDASDTSRSKSPSSNKKGTEEGEVLKSPAYFSLYFTQGSASLSADYARIHLSSGSSDGEIRLNCNSRSLGLLAQAILDDNDKALAIVNLAGHANDLPPSRKFGSNYEISQARAEEVRSQTQVFLGKELESRRSVASKELEGRRSVASKETKVRVQDIDSPGFSFRSLYNVEYRILPRSEEAIEAAEEHSPFKGCESIAVPSLSVEVRLAFQPLDAVNEEAQASVAPLTLFDHFYFMTYTITTTGYGDIKPRSPTVKLFTCVANFTELFFLTVFFNLAITVTRAVLTSESEEKPARLEQEKAAQSKT